MSQNNSFSNMTYEKQNSAGEHGTQKEKILWNMKIVKRD